MQKVLSSFSTEKLLDEHVVYLYMAIGLYLLRKQMYELIMFQITLMHEAAAAIMVLLLAISWIILVQNLPPRM